MTSENETSAKVPGRPDRKPVLTPTAFRLQLGSNICFGLAMCFVALMLYKVYQINSVPGDAVNVAEQMGLLIGECKTYGIIGLILSALSGLLIVIRRAYDGTLVPRK